MIHSLVSNEENQLLLLLLETTHNWLQLLESGRDVRAIFFDLKKALNSVPHCTLIDKLKNINLNPLLLHWIKSYGNSLGGVNKSYIVNGEKSDTLPVLSGVPQGSVVIGPLCMASKQPPYLVKAI